MYFYEILQSIMKEKDLNIPEVSRLSGLTDSTIRSIISRKNKTVALEVAFKLAKGLNVSLEELNGEKDISINPSPVKKQVLESIDSLNDEQWILTGEGDRYSTQANFPELSPAKKRVIAEIEKMSEAELDAVKVFINSLGEYKKAFNASDKISSHNSEK